jgi:hypothetical protein
MKKLILFFSVILSLTYCTTQNISEKKEGNVSLKPQVNEEGEYDLIVIDDRYDYYLNAVAQPMNSYTEEYLKSRNRTLVSEWNSYYFSGRYRNIIESSIDYDPNIEYGLKYEYKLFQVFHYIQWRYGLKLSGISGSAFR